MYEAGPQVTTCSKLRLWAQPSVSVLLGAGILALPAVLNGQPVFYTDTTAYILSANEGIKLVLGPAAGADWGAAAAGGGGLGGLTSTEEGVFLKGRSIYFGAALWLSYHIGTFWSLVALHALIVAYLTHFLAVRVAGATHAVFLAAIAFLAFATPAGFFVGMLMPDILAGAAILAFAALAIRWEDLSVAERLAIVAILLYALVSHVTHLLIIFSLVAAWLSLTLFRAGYRGLTCRGVRAPMAVVTGCLLIAAASDMAFDAGVKAFRGVEPVRLPHLTARIAASPTGLAHLRQTCEQRRFEICRRLPEQPTDWQVFLFGTDLGTGVFHNADAAAKRALSREQTSVFIDYLMSNPIAATVEFARDATTQLLEFGVNDLYYDEAMARRVAARGPDAVVHDMRQTSLFARRDILDLLGIVYYLGIIASVAFIVLRTLRGGERQDASRHTRDALIVLLAGVAINAAICGILASPLPRFQARIVWIVAVAALVVHAATARRLHAHGRSPSSPLHSSQ